MAINLIQYKGKAYTVQDLAEISCCSIALLRKRLKERWSIEKAVTTPTSTYLNALERRKPRIIPNPKVKERLKAIMAIPLNPRADYCTYLRTVAAENRAAALRNFEADHNYIYKK